MNVWLWEDYVGQFDLRIGRKKLFDSASISGEMKALWIQPMILQIEIILEATIEVLNLGHNIIKLIMPNCILSFICKFLYVLSFYLQKEKVFKVNVVLCSVYQKRYYCSTRLTRNERTVKLIKILKGISQKFRWKNLKF